MPLKVAADGKSANHPYDNKRSDIPKDQFGDAVKVIHKIDLSCLSGGQKSNVKVEGTVRLDRQNPPSGGGSNVQVQVNGMDGHSTIATLILGPDVLSVNDKPAGRKTTQVNTILKTVKSAFIKSLETGNKYKITGTMFEETTKGKA